MGILKKTVRLDSLEIPKIGHSGLIIKSQTRPGMSALHFSIEVLKLVATVGLMYLDSCGICTCLISNQAT